MKQVNTIILKIFLTNFQIVQTYFYSRNPLELRRAWDAVLAKVLLKIEIAKEKAVWACGNNRRLVEIVKREWYNILEGVVINMYKYKETVESLRIEAASKTPVEWNQFSQESVNQWITFDEVLSRGVVQEVRIFMKNFVQFTHQYGTKIKLTLAVRTVHPKPVYN